MADEKEATNVLGDALWFFGLIAVLVVLWYFAGGPGKADLRGIFLAPPAPLGTGEAYGPDFGTSTVEAPEPIEDDSAEGYYNY